MFVMQRANIGGWIAVISVNQTTALKLPARVRKNSPENLLLYLC